MVLEEYEREEKDCFNYFFQACLWGIIVEIPAMMLGVAAHDSYSYDCLVFPSWERNRQMDTQTHRGEKEGTREKWEVNDQEEEGERQEEKERVRERGIILWLWLHFIFHASSYIFQEPELGFVVNSLPKKTYSPNK